ncbi:MAG: hypothetical protein K6F56_06545 [Oscillospiraceae bacterium]|nr:hypothetical protein [Oscillospiraceae bacterium]
MTEQTKKERLFWLWLGLAMAAFYVLAALLEGYHLYPDSESYMTLDISREPLYSLFLALMRLLFGRGGESFWLQAAALVQSLVTAWAGWYFVRRCAGLFRLRGGEALLLALCTLLPALLCRFFANRRAMYSYSIISESLAFPLFLAFFTFLLAYALRGRKRDLARAAVLAFLLISLRKQMYITLPLLLLAALWRAVRAGRLLLRAGLALLTCAAVLLANSLLDRGFNYAVRGEALRHTGDTRFVTTMLLYTAQPEDAEGFQDAQLRGLFEEILRRADEERLLRGYAPADWFGRSLFFMNHYDFIQFNCLRDTVTAHLEQTEGLDETAAALERDRLYNGLNAALLPTGWTRALGTAADSFAMGLVNTAAAMKRPLIPATALLYAAFLALLVVCIRRRREDEAVLACLALAAILGNVALVSLTIFCQPRYTLYNMPVFYAALLLMLRGTVKKK